METILKYPDQINQYLEISSQYPHHQALGIIKKQDPSLDLFDLKYHLHSGYFALSEEGMLELYGKLSDIRKTTKYQVPLGYCIWPPYTVSLGIFRQTFFLLDTHKVSSGSGGVGERVVKTTKDTSNQSIEEMRVIL